MPVWSREELLVCRSVCFPHVPPADVDKAFKLWYNTKYLFVMSVISDRGGVCRYVLEKTSAVDQQLLQTAIQGADINRLSAYISNPSEESPDMPHTLLHFVVLDAEYSMVKAAWASHYIAREVARRVVLRAREAASLLVVGAAGCNAVFGAARGMLFEGLAHATLSSRSEQVLQLQSLKTDAKRDVVVKLSSYELFTEPRELKHAGVYAQPLAHNYPALDAIVIPSQPKAPLLLLQMTVSEDHPVKRRALKEAIDDLAEELRKDREICLVFVVPEDVAPKFAQQNYLTSNGKVAKEQDCAGVSQYKLVIHDVAVQTAMRAPDVGSVFADGK